MRVTLRKLGRARSQDRALRQVTKTEILDSIRKLAQVCIADTPVLVQTLQRKNALVVALGQREFFNLLKNAFISKSLPFKLDAISVGNQLDRKRRILFRC